MPTVQPTDGSTACNGVHPFLRSITLRGLLSFGPKTPALPLANLNILIGANGSGKSNLIEALSLLQATPAQDSRRDLSAMIRNGDGVEEWIWKGAPKDVAMIDAVLCYPGGTHPLRHRLAFRAANQSFRLDDERITYEHPISSQRPGFDYRYERGRPVLKSGGVERRLEPESIDPDLSILAQRRDPESYPELAYLADAYGKMRIYRKWVFGRDAVFREPQKADMRNDRLEEDFTNLGLFLNWLSRFPRAKNAILAGLRDFYEGFSDFNVFIQGGTVQIFFTEGDFTIPATRLSDGTLHYLCLLAILCDPEPPPLICIEEPELVDLLVAAAERTQLIVTTHSDLLVDAMTERPDSVVVCEKHDGQTEVRRLDAQALAGWLEKYRLGELWTRGELGGTRW